MSHCTPGAHDRLETRASAHKSYRSIMGAAQNRCDRLSIQLMLCVLGRYRNDRNDGRLYPVPETARHVQATLEPSRGSRRTCDCSARRSALALSASRAQATSPKSLSGRCRPKRSRVPDESSHSRSARPASVALTRHGGNQLRVAKLATKADARYSITLSASTRIDCWICIAAPRLGDARSRPI